MRSRHIVPGLLLLALAAESLPGVRVNYGPGPDIVITRWLSHWNFGHMNPLAMLALAATLLALIHVLLLFKAQGDYGFLYVMTVLWSLAGAIAEGVLLFRYTLPTPSRRFLLPAAAAIFLAGAAAAAVIFRRSMRFED